jgi:O-acetyl-ADP-ribose deacetylase (regulator of RNase III)
MMDVKEKFLSNTGILLEIGQGDITQEITDAIVNAANSHLSHGGGVALAISRRGGATIDQESRKWVADHGPVRFDAPAYTSGGNMPCRYVIHAVGPVWGEGDEDKKLAAAIRSSLDLAEKLGVKSIAFPAISTGIFGFPVNRAAALFMQEFKEYLSNADADAVKIIKMILFDKSTLDEFLAAFEDVFNQSQAK